MPQLGERLARLTPYQRFTLLVAAAFIVGTVVLSATIAWVIERYIADQTATQTAREIDEHYRVILGNTIFQRPLNPDEQRRFVTTIKFHLDVYDIVQATLYRPDGTIVYSYTPELIGQSAFSRPDADRARRAAAGERSYELAGGAALDGQIPNPPSGIMRVWVPTHKDGQIIGVTEVSRDSDALRRTVGGMQGLATGLVVVASVILFLSLRKIYADSTDQIRKQEAAERSARAQVAAMEELARLKDAFVSQVSHELRTPLQPIVGFAELLATRAESPADVQRYAAIIGRQSQVLLRLVDDLLDLARFESGRYQLDRQPLDLPRLLEERTRELRLLSQSHPIELDIAPNLPAVDADPGRVEQIINNLVGNAVRYSPGGGAVRVRATRDGDAVRVSVSDSGIGIPEDRQARVFEKFYRIDSELTRSVAGTGLGLAICRELVEAHGGRIWIDSSAGRGSTFHFILPRSADPVSETSGVPRPSPAPVAGG